MANFNLESIKEAFVNKADSGELSLKKEMKKKKKLYYTSMSFSEKQVAFLNDISEKSGLRIDYLFYKAITYANKALLDDDFFFAHEAFVLERKAGTRLNIKRVSTLFEDLKELVELYSQRGLPINLKGVALLYTLNFAQKELGIDISAYQ